jgi:hypothetical protein
MEEKTFKWHYLCGITYKGSNDVNTLKLKLNFLNI